MSNGYSFQSYPVGPTPDPKQVGAMLQQKAAATAAGMSVPGMVEPSAAPAPDMLGELAGSVDAWSGRGLPGQADTALSSRPALETIDNDYDPAVEHSASATALALEDMQRRTDGGVAGQGRVQNPSSASPMQQQQLLKMGLSPTEIALLTGAGALKAG